MLPSPGQTPLTFFFPNKSPREASTSFGKVTTLEERDLQRAGIFMATPQTRALTENSVPKGKARQQLQVLTRFRNTNETHKEANSWWEILWGSSALAAGALTPMPWALVKTEDPRPQTQKVCSWWARSTCIWAATAKLTYMLVPVPGIRVSHSSPWSPLLSRLFPAIPSPPVPNACMPCPYTPTLSLPGEHSPCPCPATLHNLWDSDTGITTSRKSSSRKTLPGLTDSPLL